MKFKVKKRIQLGCVPIIFTVLLGCSHDNATLPEMQASIMSDSISLLLSESETLSLGDHQRLHLLLKAESKIGLNQTDSIKSKYYNLLSQKFPLSLDSAAFRKIVKNTIELNKKVNDTGALATSFVRLADFFNLYAINDSAYYYYSEAQQLYENEQNLKLSGKMLLNIAIMQIAVKDYIGSETMATRAIERFKLINDDFNLFACYNVLGVTQGALGEIEKSLNYYNEALFYLDKDILNDYNKARIINNIGIVYKNDKQYNKAIENFKTVVNTNGLKLNEPRLYAVGLSNLAASKLYNNDTIGVYRQFMKAIEIKKNNRQIPSLAGSYFNYAEYKAYAKDTVSAIEFAKKAEQLSIQSENNEKLLETWAFLAELDKQNASHYFKEYRELDDRLQKEERQLQNKFARIRFETDEFIAENVELESEKESLFKQKQMWTGLAAGFFILGLSIYIVVNERSRKQKLQFERQQQETNQEIFNLMLTQKQKVDEVKRMEQKRISEELHDGVLGKMLGARMVLTGLNKRATEEAIKEKSKAISSLQEIENEIRTISHELSHSAYQNINNFTDSILILLQNSSTNTPITTNFNFNTHEDWDAIDGEIKINVYRIVQETFQNALKHAQSTEFNVTFDLSEEYLDIRVSDDGLGFKVHRHRKGIGMRNIGSRVLKLNGSWNINSIEGEGTTITMKFPLKKKS